MNEQTGRLLWFDDGDIILVALKTDLNINPSARIHRHILYDSPVFKDMLALPQPKDSETKDGCPVIQIPDPAEDLSALLTALYDGLKLYGQNDFTLDDKLRILKMSTKYQMNGLRRSIILLLRRDWPSKHSEYLHRKKLLGELFPRTKESVKVFKAAMEYDVHVLLPAVMAELSFNCPADWTKDEMTEYYKLSQAELTHIAVGRQRSMRRLYPVNRREAWDLKWTRNDVEDVSSGRPSCRRTSLNDCAMDFCDGLTGQILNGSSPYTIAETLVDDCAYLCKRCKKWFLTMSENKSQEIWENILTDSDLPSIGHNLYDESIL